MEFLRKKFSRNTFQLIVGFLVFGVILGSGYRVGYVQGKKVPETIFIKGLANIGDPDITADFAVFWEAWQKLKELHINGDKITDQKFVYSAISGLASAFDDPNTSFFPPEDAKNFKENIKGSFAGIGAEIGTRDGELVVIAAIKDSPAERAGLVPGDRILKIDNEPTTGLSVDEAVRKIRGDKGTTVVFEILSPDATETKSVSIIRDIIIVPTLASEMLEDNIWYVELYNFNENAVPQFQQAAVKAIREGVNGIVFDLRNNPGGFLEVSIDLAGWFLERGSVVVTEDFRSEPDQIFEAHGNEIFKNVPMVILVNGGSASASEILAGALRVNRDDIKLIGEQTYGKGTVQQLHSLTDDSDLKITIAQWLLPDGSTIEKNGLKPDVEIKLTAKDIENKKDVQREKAIEVLREEIHKQ